MLVTNQNELNQFFSKLEVGCGHLSGTTSVERNEIMEAAGWNQDRSGARYSIDGARVFQSCRWTPGGLTREEAGYWRLSYNNQEYYFLTFDEMVSGGSLKIAQDWVLTV